MMDGWMDDGQIYGWMGGWMDEQVPIWAEVRQVTPNTFFWGGSKMFLQGSLSSLGFNRYHSGNEYKSHSCLMFPSLVRVWRLDKYIFRLQQYFSSFSRFKGLDAGESPRQPLSSVSTFRCNKRNSIGEISQILFFVFYLSNISNTSFLPKLQEFFFKTRRKEQKESQI